MYETKDNRVLDPPAVPENVQAWLQQHGPLELACLHRAVVFNPCLSLVPSAEPPAQPLSSARYLVDLAGRILTWDAGAAAIYGYQADEAIGMGVWLLYPEQTDVTAGLRRELNRAGTESHFCAEGPQIRKGGIPFWANIVTMALRDQDSALQGYARVVRDFDEAHAKEEKLNRGRVHHTSLPPEPPVAGVVFSQFEQITEANDMFLELAGYAREDMEAGKLNWPDLTPPECAPLDAQAHEEALRLGACVPFEKELIRKDGSRIPISVTTAIQKLCPYTWISFVHDLRSRDLLELVDAAPSEAEPDFKEMIGVSAALKRVMRQIEVVAPTGATVLILGETGTGKELVARALHRLSPRRNLPCITLNCAAIPTGLLESELFGYERGAFTGALSQKIGRFEMAHRGTLFLDEVGDIPLDLQPKLLRALQEKSFERLGGTRTIPINVRLIAATNRDLSQMMVDKLFRSDLYYRLNVFPITTPPLRDRPEDIPVLARHFTSKYSKIMDRKIEKIPADTMRALVKWNWPGNVRELENFIERAVILSSGPNLRAPLAEIRDNPRSYDSNATLESVERDHIVRVFRESGGVVTTAATRLGLHRTTLNAIMRKLGISRGDL